MSTGSPLELRLSPALALRVAVTTVGALVVLLALARSRTVLHWCVTAAVAALLLDGPVRALAARRVSRGLAVALVTVATLAGAGLLTYGVVDTVVEQYGSLQETAPAAVADLVRSGPLRGAAERAEVVERVDDIVSQAPGRLFGSPASVARTAAERVGEVALVLTLTVFMLVAYERFEQRVQRLQDTGHPWRWTGLDAGVATGARSARHVMARAVALGVLTAVVADVAGAPAPVVLGLWMAWWRLLPVLGLVVGYAPFVVLLVNDRPVLVAVGAVLTVVVAESVAWVFVWSASLESDLHVPMAFLTALAFFAGFEMSGVTGSVVAVVLAHLAVGVLQGAASRAGEEVPRRPDRWRASRRPALR